MQGNSHAQLRNCQLTTSIWKNEFLTRTISHEFNIKATDQGMPATRRVIY
jgi:hypothetical protein